MKIPGAMLIRPLDVLLKAEQKKSETTPTDTGLQLAQEKAASCGSSRIAVVAGNVALALKPTTFAEMEQVFGKAKEVAPSVHAFNEAGSNLLVNWYNTAMYVEGYGVADKDGDGRITYLEADNTRCIIDIGANGNVVLRTPAPGDHGRSGDNDVYVTLDEAIDRDIAQDQNKDGVITVSEYRSSGGLDIDWLRGVHGFNPDGTPAVSTEDDLKFDLPGLIKLRRTHHATLRERLKAIETELRELRTQGAGDSDEKVTRLQAEQKALTAELVRSESGQRIDVKA